MGIESVAGIWDLNDIWPLSTDRRATSDSHHRLEKSALKSTFPEISATIDVSAAEINYLSGLDRNLNSWHDVVSATIETVSSNVNSLSQSVAVVSANLSTVKSNLDTLSANVGNIFSGITTITGTTGSVWPSGWVIERSAAGLYSITHGRGDAFPVIHLSSVNNAQPYCRTQSANGFLIGGYNLSSGATADIVITFTVHFIP